MTDVGLREAKRRATAHALARTAFDLASERGIDGFTIDEVTEQAGVSRRTFANYYSCKEEAVTALAIEQLREGIDTMPEMPDSTPLLDWVKALAKHQLSGGMLPLLRQLRELARRHPTLDPHLSEVHTQIRRAAQETISGRAGSGFSQLTAHILVGAAYGALMAGLDGTSTSVLEGNSDPPADTDMTIDDFLGTVFSQLRSGF